MVNLNSSWLSRSNILCSWFSEDTSTSLGVGETTIAQAVTAGWVVTPNAVLSVVELTQCTRYTSGGFELDALCGVTGDEGVGAKAKGDLSESVLHIEYFSRVC
jgi:hypothetical protein